MDNQVESVSAAFPFASHYLNVNHSDLHYIDEGQGDPIVFLHGVPSSNYLWRNIIPYLSSHARCIAPDLIGFGKSSKPNIRYRVFDHINYIEQFLDQLDLEKITLVMHGWGSVIGLDYASRHPKKIKNIAFFEPYIRPAVNFEMLSLPLQELCRILHNSDGGYNFIVNSNYFVNTAFSSGAIKKVNDEVVAHYQAPFPDARSRLPLWQFTQDLPLGDGPADVVELMQHYSLWLQKSNIPKLFIYAVPGFLTTIDTVQWAKTHISKLSLVDIGDAHHYVQETNPDAFGAQLRNWYVNHK